jgi:peptide/nickel transport system permease protein
MRNFFIRRLIQSALLLWVVMSATFVLVRLTPGGPEAAMLQQEGITQEDVARLRERFGLADPLPVAYVKWVGNAIRLDFGRSYHYARPPLEVVKERLWPTIQLQGVAWLIGLTGIPLGLLAATYRGRPPDIVIRVFTVLGDATPNWWMALVIIVLLSTTIGWFPQGQGRGSLLAWFQHIIVPAFILGLGLVVAFARFTRSQVLEVLGQDHVRTARAKGLAENLVASRHVLRNALTPAVTIFGSLLPFLIGGAALTEGIFNWPGTGRLFLEAALTRDYPMILAIVTLGTVATLVGTLLADLIYGLVDPRVRYS